MKGVPSALRRLYGIGLGRASGFGRLFIGRLGLRW
jgi:hypothetical protein